MTARRALSWVLLIAVLGALWFGLAPHQLGGRTSYVKVKGVSMLPTFRTGDLIMLRSKDDYRVGDIVAYRSDMAGAVVIHRIIGLNGDRFVMKGDNNDFLDRYQPRARDVLGREVLRVPGGSGLTDFLASRSYLVLATATAAALVIAGAVSARRHDTRRRRRRSHEVLA